MDLAWQAWIIVAAPPLAQLDQVATFFGRSLTTDPDVLVLQPEEGSQTIKIEQVRELSLFLATRPLTAQGRLILLAPAEAISAAAAQALLKLLEEPPANTKLVLVASAAASLPATVRSRCRIVALPSADDRSANLLTQIAVASTLTEKIKLLDRFPKEREELKAVLLAELSQPVPPTPAGVWLKERALAAYEALQVNVTPQLALDSLLVEARSR